MPRHGNSFHIQIPCDIKQSLLTSSSAGGCAPAPLSLMSAEPHFDILRGFAPPGTCTLVEFPEQLKTNDRGCKWVALCPTMREPENVDWNREVVYECVWSLLCQVEGHNRGSRERIRSVLMTPLAA